MELSKLPKVDRVVEAPALAGPRAALGPRALTAIARGVIGEFRTRVRSGEPVPSFERVVAEVASVAERRMHAGLERVINATGVLLHTNLGRAPLPVESIERIAAVASGYCNLELDAELGVRSRRGSALEHAMAELVGAEQALLVNNNAAAVLLALTAIAGGREVIVSRGELVEIGGGFRIPEVLERSGATLVEVGTTNRTRVSDYAAAISERTACILRVHPSNFKVTGFTERPALAELVALAHARGLALVKDLGGGLLVDLPRELAASAELGEPTVQQCLRAGTDLVCFSLDKLFGGPQGGVVCGSARWISALKGDPLARALRVDKLTLAALEPIVRKYALGQIEAIPVHAMLRASIEGLFARAQAWRDELAELGEQTSVIHTQAAVGGGTLAEAPLGSAALRIDVAAAEDIAAALRRERPPVIGRIADDRFLLDARTVLPGEDEALVGALTRVLRARQAQRP